MTALGVVRDLRDVRAPVSAEELEQFDVGAGGRSVRAPAAC
ncbi:hypothetical protein [Streptomyces sp. NPDC059970]